MGRGRVLAPEMLKPRAAYDGENCDAGFQRFTAELNSERTLKLVKVMIAVIDSSGMTSTPVKLQTEYN